MIFDKRIDSLVAKAFIGPYFMAFVIAEFVLVMQFLWKYIDDITGKGIGLFEILELVFYFSLTLIPTAIPITILLASVFVFGNMSETFQLTSLKSAGISFFRVVRMGIVIGVLTALISVIASNMIVPKAYYVFYKGFNSIKKHKPALVIEEGMFNEDFSNYKIYVGSKSKDGKTISDIKIYDQSNVDSRRINLITAQSGEMSTSPDGKLFIMTLFDGEQIRDLKENIAKNKGVKKYPMTRSTFKKWEKSFDMSEFQLKKEGNVSTTNSFDLMNTPQLLYSIDSVSTEVISLNERNIYNYDKMVHIENDLYNIEPKSYTRSDDGTVKKNEVKEYNKPNKPVVRKTGFSKTGKYNSVLNDSLDLATAGSFLKLIKSGEQKSILKSAYTKANHMNNQVLSNDNKIRINLAKKRRFLYKLHQQYSHAFICILFLFIGAPLGSIIRKGGYGFPLLISIIFFMLFIIMQIMGSRLQGSGVLNPYIAAWLPNITMLPFAVIFTYKAIRDSRFNFQALLSRFSRT